MSTYDKKSEMLSNMGISVQDVANWCGHEAANAEDDEIENMFCEVQERLDDITERRIANERHKNTFANK